jgi:DNA-binding NarL/FixJ family response regulator
MTIRILLAEDHAIVRTGIRSLVDRQADMEVIGEVEDGRSAVNAAREGSPDIVIMDVSMPELNGIEATRQIKSEMTGVRAICLSMHAEKQFVTAALEAGASGYLVKECALEQLIEAITVVTAGQVYLCPAVTGTVVDAMKEKRRSADSSVFSLLTDREREVLQLIAEGFSTKEIADRLVVSAKTISTHREHLMAKLEIHSVAGLTKYAIREGLTSTA